MAVRALIAVETPRLQLVALPAAERDEIERDLDVRLPRDWPSREVRSLLSWYARALAGDGSLVGWGPWLILDRRNAVVGDVGFKGRADDEGRVEIGYGVRRSRRGRGYATEAAPRSRPGRSQTIASGPSSPRAR